MAPIAVYEPPTAPIGPFLTVMKSVQGDSSAMSVWPGKIDIIRHSHHGHIVTAQITRTGDEFVEHKGEISAVKMVSERRYCKLHDYD